LKHSHTTIRVRYAETDQMQVVYYANYFVWFEVGRGELLRSLGSTYRALEESGFLLPVIRADCRYRRPARYDDELTIRTQVRLLSAARLRFDYEVHRRADQVLTATGCTTHAVINQKGKPTALPVQIREVLE
jgi:acyl-CoA thioester hydrolase